METIKEVFHKAFKEIFDLRKDVATHNEIKASIISGGEIKGTNMCVLVLAIIIASIGLNMNSTAVIIGAMIISPLMGSIMAMAYGLAATDLKLAKKSFDGLVLQIIICIIASTLYFLVSPIKNASTELIARTSPTVWDVFIAICGGLAGIIGNTRKEKGNVIPGVAIATALMPPLCTVGYGIATWQPKFIFGAFYLFILNSYFIGLTAIVILTILKVPSIYEKPVENKKRFMRKIVIITVITIIPSIFFAYGLVKDSENKSVAVMTDRRLGTLNIEIVTKEIKLIYPEVDEIHIGYLEKWDEEKKRLDDELTAILYVNEKLSDKKIEIIQKWMEINYNESVVVKQAMVE